jgi:cell wall assembly regulator SMI1
MDDALWDRWNADWRWVTSALRRHGCEADGPSIAPPATRDELAAVERECGVTFPRDFAEVVTRYAVSVSLSWETRNPLNEREWHEFSAPYQHLMSSRSDYLWNLVDYPSLWESFRFLQQVCTQEQPPENEPHWDEFDVWYNSVWQGSIPLLRVPNGEFIGFYLTEGTAESCPIVYLSHNGGVLHGLRLADSFTQFITEWSAVGCPGPEGSDLSSFHDEELDRLNARTPFADGWRALLDDSAP